MDNDSLESMDCEIIEAEKDWIKSVLEQYRVSYRHGFIPDQDPLLRFSDPYFSPWDDIFKKLADLIQSQQLRESVDNMPLLDQNKLGIEEDWARACMVLSAIGNGYIWQDGEDNPVKVVPKCLAVPWVAVAEHAGGCPVIGHWNGILQNWKIKDKSKPLDISNIDTQFAFTGTKDEFWFCAVTWQLEMHAVPGVKSVVAAQKAVTDDNQNLLQSCLVTIQKTIEQLKKTLNRMFEDCDPEVFYTKIRIFLAGFSSERNKVIVDKTCGISWKSNKAFPEGLIYEGVNSKPMQFSGGSAAQSTVFQVFDAVLGIVHPKEAGPLLLENSNSDVVITTFVVTAALRIRRDGDKSFLERMLDYMPRWHREFVYYVRNGPSVRNYVRNSGSEHLRKLYNECVESLVKFRSFHIQIVTRYITIQAAKGNRDGVKMLASQGTGGTGIMPFLKGVRKETADVKMDSVNIMKDIH